MEKSKPKNVLVIGGVILALFLVFNLLFDEKRYKVHEETTIVAGYVQKFGDSWYIDETHLQKTFKSGIWNPKTGDRINIKLDDKGRVIAWRVRKMKSASG